MNDGNDALDIAEDIIVPKSKDAISVHSQISIADMVSLRIRVLAAIYLDDELLLATNEIAEVGSYRYLSHKFVAIDLPGANAAPKFRFRLSLADAQMSCETRDVWLWTTHANYPSPGSFHDPTSPRKQGEVRTACNRRSLILPLPVCGERVGVRGCSQIGVGAAGR